MAGPGELHFFDDKWERGTDWYEKQFADVEKGQLCGEKTPAYGFHPEVPERIYSVVPGVKLIWILRNPIERAYSGYWHAVQAGGEPLSFTESLLREQERGSTERRYAKRGRYEQQIRRFLKHFDRSGMFFSTFERFISNTKNVLDEVMGFLGVDRSKEIAHPLIHANSSYAYHSPRIQHVARRVFGRGRLPFRIIKRLNRASTPGRPPIPQEARAYLHDYFEKANKNLSELTGLDLSNWQSQAPTQ